jgi:hypothetical protein
MSETQVKVEVEEAAEPTVEEVELLAARQLLNELLMIKRRIYGIPMNGVLLMQVKQLIRGLMRKYQEFGLFSDDDIAVKFIRKQNAVDFTPSENLRKLFVTVTSEAMEAQQQKEQNDSTDEV